MTDSKHTQILTTRHSLVQRAQMSTLWIAVAFVQCWLHGHRHGHGSCLTLDPLARAARARANTSMASWEALLDAASSPSGSGPSGSGPSGGGPSGGTASWEALLQEQASASVASDAAATSSGGHGWDSAVEAAAIVAAAALPEAGVAEADAQAAPDGAGLAAEHRSRRGRPSGSVLCRALVAQAMVDRDGGDNEAIAIADPDGMEGLRLQRLRQQAAHARGVLRARAEGHAAIQEQLRVAKATSSPVSQRLTALVAVLQHDPTKTKLRSQKDDLRIAHTLLDLPYKDGRTDDGGDGEEASRARRRGDCHVLSAVAEAKSLGVHWKTLQSDYNRLAAAVSLLASSNLASMLEALQRVCEGTGMTPSFFLWRVRYDETPLRTRSKLRGLVGISAEAKILQSEVEWCMVIKKGAAAEGGTPSYFMIRGSQPTWLQVVDRTTAECLKAAIQDVAPIPHIVHGMFTYKARLPTTDHYAANVRAELSILKDLREKSLAWGLLHLLCDVHKAHTCAARMFLLVKRDVSAIIDLALSTNQLGDFALMRRTLVQVVAQRLVIRQGRPPEHLQRYKLKVLDLYLSTEGRKQGLRTRRLQRASLLLVANGDWTKNDCVEHYFMPGTSPPMPILRQVLQGNQELLKRLRLSRLSDSVDRN